MTADSFTAIRIQHRLAFGLRVGDGVRTQAWPAGPLAGPPPFEPAEVSALAEWPGEPGTPQRPVPLSWRPMLGGSTRGRFRVLHPVHPDDKQVTVRLIEPLRRYVPRRVSLDFPSLSDVLIAEAAGLSAPRAWTVLLWPGARHPAHGAATGLRGRAVDPTSAPVPWVRVRAATVTGDFTLGIAHGDDRGEFLLLLGAGRHSEAVPKAQSFTITVTVWVPPKIGGDTGYPGDPLAALPVEPLTAGQPADDGATPPASYAKVTPALDVDIRLGRIRSIPDVTVPAPLPPTPPSP